MPTSATYTKLRTGAWGLRIVGPTPAPGEQVTVTKRGGVTKREQVRAILWRGDGVALATIAALGEAAPTPALRPRVRQWEPCGASDCRPQGCDECDGEGHYT